MRTNIDIDDALMEAAMKGGHFKTKREAVEEGLRLVARRNHALEVLKWEGRLHWDDQPDQVPAAVGSGMLRVMSPEAVHDAKGHDKP